MGLNQEEAAATKERKKQLQNLMKDTMKKVGTANASVKGTSQPRKAAIEGKRKKGKKRSQPSKERVSEKEPKAKKGEGDKKKAKPQGGRSVPKATDTHGCKHKGLMELKVLPSNYLMGYMKEGGWLHKKPCKDCVRVGECGEDEDLTQILPKKGIKDVGYYCNCGPTGHEMKEEHPLKTEYTCDLVLCMKCYDKRKEGMGRPSRRRK